MNSINRMTRMTGMARQQSRRPLELLGTAATRKHEPLVAMLHRCIVSSFLE